MWVYSRVSKAHKSKVLASVVSTLYICYTTLAMNCCRVMFYVIMSSKGRTWFVVSFKPLMTHYMRHKPTQPSHQHILSCFQNHSCVDQCSFLQNTAVIVQAFVKLHVNVFTLSLQLFRILQFDQTSRVWFCRRLPSLPSSKGALQLPFLQPFKGTASLKRPKFAILYLFYPLCLQVFCNRDFEYVPFGIHATLCP